jgi:hypothetical protein
MSLKVRKGNPNHQLAILKSPHFGICKFKFCWSAPEIYDAEGDFVLVLAGYRH